jgi:hypothetical protein
LNRAAFIAAAGALALVEATGARLLKIRAAKMWPSRTKTKASLVRRRRESALSTRSAPKAAARPAFEEARGPEAAARPPRPRVSTPARARGLPRDLARRPIGAPIHVRRLRGAIHPT